jgi:hypothetical protein
MQYFHFQKPWLLYCFMIIPQPMTLVLQPEPFDNWDWIYEIKHDGFRAWRSSSMGSAGSFPGRSIGSPAIKTFELAW